MTEREESRLAFVSVITTEYLPQIMALRSSLQCLYGPDVALSVLLVGDEAAIRFARQRGLDVVAPPELDIPSFWDMAFRYEKGALANALKPFFLQHVMRTGRARMAVLIDADTLVYSPLDEVEALLGEERASIILTPHFERPQVRQREPTERDLLRAGMVNGGFVAVRADPAADKFLAWWSDHMLTDCRYELEKGLYGDQHWLSFVPSLFDGVHVLRHRGYNAAYWNFPDRRPRRERGEWIIDGDPLRFFHFSQWRIGQGETVDACMERLFQGGDDELRALLVRYRESVRIAGAAVPPDLLTADYPYGRFLDGTPIPKIVRDAYAALEHLQSSDRSENFGGALGRLLQPSRAFPTDDGVGIPELYVHIWRGRPDLHNGRIDLGTPDGQAEFLRWLLKHGAEDYALPQAVLEPARWALRSRQTLVLSQGTDVDGAVSRAMTSLEAVRALHAGPKPTAGALQEMLTSAGTMLAALSGLFELPCATALDTTEALFSNVRALRAELRAKPGTALFENDFEAVERHRSYLAEKRAEHPAGGAEHPPGVVSGAEGGAEGGDEEADRERIRALEADAVVNTCGNLMSIIEKTAAAVRESRPDAAHSSSEPVAGRRTALKLG